MKMNFLKTFCIAVLAISFSFSVSAQKLFSGIIEYEISYTDADLDAATMAMLPKSMLIEVSGKRSKLEQQQGILNIIKINNAENKTSIVLLDVMGQKYAIRTSAEEIEKALADMPKPQITYTDETKMIAGVKAQKAIVIFTEEDGTETIEEVYFAPEIGGENFNFDTPYRDIKGALLEYGNDNEMFKSKMVAKTIKKKKIKPTAFLIPTDYKEVTSEELQEIFGGM